MENTTFSPDQAEAKPKPPWGLRFETSADELVFRRRWLSPGSASVVFGTVVLDGVLIRFADDFVKPFLSGPFVVVVLFFGLFVFLANYVALCVLVNTSTYRIGRELHVRHGPLPLLFRRGVDLQGIEQVLVDKRQVHSPGIEHHHHQTTYAVVAQLSPGPKRDIASQFHSQKRAEYVARRIRRHFDHTEPHHCSPVSPGLRSMA